MARRAFGYVAEAAIRSRWRHSRPRAPPAPHLVNAHWYGLIAPGDVYALPQSALHEFVTLPAAASCDDSFMAQATCKNQKMLAAE